jgi:hypothetical protein
LKKIAYFIVGILLISSIATISIGKEEKLVEKTTLSISKSVITEIDEYIKVEISEAESLLLEEGKPILPVITKVFTYPIGTIINDVNVEYNVEEKILNKKIQPSPKPVVLSSIEIQRASSEPTINQDIYQSTDMYPSDPLIISKNVGMMNGENVMILNVKVTPQYSPANDILYLPEDEIKIMVEYELPDVTYGATNNDDYKMVIITIDEFEDELQPLVTHKFNMGINTMIKTVEDIYNEYPDGRDNAEKIKLFIYDMKETNNISYVLLAGGRKGQTLNWNVPSRTVHNDDGWEAGYESDLYFSDIYKYNNVSGYTFEDWDSNKNGVIGEFDGFRSDKPDYFPDVSVGRIPFRSASEIQPMIDKIVEYETQADDSWFKKGIVVSGDTFPPSRGGAAGAPEGIIETGVTVGLLESLGFIMNKLWTSIPGAWTGPEDVLNAINEGAGFIHFAGHSNPAYWGNYLPDAESEDGYIDGISIFEMVNLKNNGEYPVVVFGGCHSSQFNVTLAHMWRDIKEYGLMGYLLKSPFRFYYFEWVPRDMSSMFVLKEDGGAIAVMGNSGLGYGYVGVETLEGLGGWIEPRFFKEYTEFGIDVVGFAHDQAIADYINIIGNMNSDQIDRKTIEEWVLIGDPSLKIGGYET